MRPGGFRDVTRQNVFGIVVLDELFTGGSSESGAVGSRLVASKLFVNPNLLTIFATHYKITDMAKDKRFNGYVKNYRMDATINQEKGTYTRSFLLEEGESEI